jgi:hypothetical protein
MTHAPQHSQALHSYPRISSIRSSNSPSAAPSSSAVSNPAAAALSILRLKLARVAKSAVLRGRAAEEGKGTFWGSVTYRGARDVRCVGQT